MRYANADSKIRRRCAKVRTSVRNCVAPIGNILPETDADALKCGIGLFMSYNYVPFGKLGEHCN